MNEAIAFLTTATASSLALIFGARLARLQYLRHPPGFVMMQVVGGVYALLVGMAAQDHGWGAPDVAGLLLAGMYAYRSRDRVHEVLNPPAERVMEFVPDTRIVARSAPRVQDAERTGT